MSEDEKQDAEIAAAAILRRFKVIEINNRQESDYWLKNITKELKPRQKIPELVMEEVKEPVPKARIALIDRTHNVPTWKKDFTYKQSVLGKRAAEEEAHSATESEEEQPSDISQYEV